MEVGCEPGELDLTVEGPPPPAPNRPGLRASSSLLLHFPHPVRRLRPLTAYPGLPTSQSSENDSPPPGSLSLGTGIMSCSSLGGKKPGCQRLARPSLQTRPCLPGTSRVKPQIQTPSRSGPGPPSPSHAPTLPSSHRGLLGLLSHPSEPLQVQCLETVLTACQAFFMPLRSQLRGHLLREAHPLTEVAVARP